MLFKVSRGDPLLDSIKLLKSSNHFPQINYVFYDSSWTSFKIDLAFELLDKPVIWVKGSLSEDGFHKMVECLGLGRNKVNDLLDVACSSTGEVEALRVSRLIALKLYGCLTA